MNKICLSLLISLCVSLSDVNSSSQPNYCRSMPKPGKPDIFITISYEIISIYMANIFYYL